MPSVVSIVLFHLLKISPYVFLITIDTPEVGPGSIIAPSTSSTAASATSSYYPYSTGSPTHASSGGSGSGSNPGAIVGGIVGGIAPICIAVAVIFFRRRHSQAQPIQGRSLPCLQMLLNQRCRRQCQMKGRLRFHRCPGHPSRGGSMYVLLCPALRLCVLKCHLLPIFVHAGPR